jgi:tetratricopeptide (TPR) repeat protein
MTQTKYLVNPSFNSGMQFVHRKEDIEKIVQLLKENGATTVVQGMGGIGKSALMQQYVKLYGNQYDHVLFLEIDSKFGETDDDTTYNRESFARAFFKDNELPDNIGFTYDKNKPDVENLKPLLNHLRNLKGNNLLLLDNVADAINEWINDLPHTDNWHILLTSRERIAEFTAYTLKPLSTDELVELFNRYYTAALKNAGFDADEAENMRDDAALADMLKGIGNHTLTAELLAKTAGEQGWTVNHLCGQVAKEELAFKKEIHSTYKGTVQRATLHEHLMARFVVSLPDDAQQILRYFSVLPTEPLSFDVLCTLFLMKDENADQLRGLLDLLVRKGWLNPNKGKWECHALIQKVLRDKLEPNDDNCEDLINGAANLLRVDVAKGEHGIHKKEYLNIGENIHLYLDCEKEYFANLCNELDCVYSDLGNYSKAIQFSLKNVRIKEKVLGNDHPDLATAYNNLALIYKDQGNYDKALEFNLKAIQILEKVLDKVHPDLATAYNNLALIYQGQGNYYEALEFNLKAVKVGEKALDKKHPLLATYYNNIASIYQDQGNYQKASEFNLKAIQIWEKVLDKDHPNLASTYNNLALIYTNQGNYQKALEFNLKAIQIREKVLDKDHPLLADSYWNIAAVYYELKDFHKAKDYIDKAVRIYQKALSPEHPYQAKVLSWQRAIDEALAAE